MFANDYNWRRLLESIHWLTNIIEWKTLRLKQPRGGHSSPLRLVQEPDCPRLTPLQLYQNITELVVAMVPIVTLILANNTSKKGKLDVSLAWEQPNFQFFLSYSQMQIHSLLKKEKEEEKIFITLRHDQVHCLLSETATSSCQSHISLGSRA